MKLALLPGRGILETVSWNRLVGVVVLAFVAALPVSKAMCVALCDSAANSAGSGHHHDSVNNAEEPDRPSAKVHIHSPQHDCGSHGTLQLASATAAARADSSVVAVPLATVVVPATFQAFAESKAFFEYHAPPRTAPLTTTPLVLRV